MRYLTNPELSELVSAVLIGGRNWNQNGRIVTHGFVKFGFKCKIKGQM